MNEKKGEKEMPAKPTEEKAKAQPSARLKKKMRERDNKRHLRK